MAIIMTSTTTGTAAPAPSSPIKAQLAFPASTTSSTANAANAKTDSNIAERRATHNALERMRRETLNGSFCAAPAKQSHDR
ncbi:hypothetical protein B0H19DRAFT_1254086 [Mycena capillaripes]|nr:hypothetical protein B0H19DRAFT_1254086 [Mycena capillaripes]